MQGSMYKIADKMITEERQRANKFEQKCAEMELVIQASKKSASIAWDQVKELKAKNEQLEVEIQTLKKKGRLEELKLQLRSQEDHASCPFNNAVDCLDCNKAIITEIRHLLDTPAKEDQ